MPAVLWLAHVKMRSNCRAKRSGWPAAQPRHEGTEWEGPTSRVYDCRKSSRQPFSANSVMRKKSGAVVHAPKNLTILRWLRLASSSASKSKQGVFLYATTRPFQRARKTVPKRPSLSPESDQVDLPRQGNPPCSPEPDKAARINFDFRRFDVHEGGRDRRHVAKADRPGI